MSFNSESRFLHQHDLRLVTFRILSKKHQYHKLSFPQFSRGNTMPNSERTFLSKWLLHSLLTPGVTRGSSNLGILSWNFPLTLGEAGRHLLGNVSSSVKWGWLPIIRLPHGLEVKSLWTCGSFVKYTALKARVEGSSATTQPEGLFISRSPRSSTALWLGVSSGCGGPSFSPIPLISSKFSVCLGEWKLETKEELPLENPSSKVVTWLEF